MFGFGKKKEVRQVNRVGDASPGEAGARRPAEAPKPVETHRPVYTQAWSAYSAAARFRGIVALLSLVAAIIAASSSLYMARNFQPIVVNVDKEGRPEILELTEIRANREIFVKDFLDRVYNYMPTNVDEKAELMLYYMTPKLQKAWIDRLGSEWIRLVKSNDVLQVLGVRDVAITGQTENTFTATVRVQMVRTERRISQTTTRNGTILMTVEFGSIDRKNPFGMYVDILKDETI